MSHMSNHNSQGITKKQIHIWYKLWRRRNTTKDNCIPITLDKNLAKAIATTTANKFSQKDWTILQTVNMKTHMLTDNNNHSSSQDSPTPSTDLKTIQFQVKNRYKNMRMKSHHSSLRFMNLKLWFRV